MPLEPSDVKLEALVPGLEKGLEAAVTAFEPVLAKQIEASKAEGNVLRYVAEISSEHVSVGLKSVPKSSPIGSLRGPDNIFVFTTERYHDNPLVIRGPGAGIEVTAAGVLGDVLKIASTTRDNLPMAS